MCEPISIASAALSTAQVGMNFLGGTQQADAQDARYQQNAANVREATANSYQGQQLEILQAGEAAGREKIENSKAALKARASAQVSAGESGVTGLSVGALIRDVHGQEASNADAIDQQAEFKGQQNVINLKNTEMTARSQINQVSRGRRPSAAAALLQLGSVGLDAYSSYTQYQSQNQNKGP